MKFFLPRNNWDMKDPDSNWKYVGAMPTVSGRRVSEETALSFSAVFAGTRVISETVASLPLKVLRQIDSRTVENAIDHPLWPLLHDAPNPEQDIMCFLDMMVAHQVLRGNAYAEIQRNVLGQIVALWPIHPSRIPLRNIRRNGQDWQKIVVGDPGEIVYYVNNDDGSTTPIPASDMMHVPGVLSDNGVTGQSIVRWAANSIGIALATEEHAGAFFKNGAVANMALKSPKVLNPAAASRLREQWQRTFGSASNNYKTLILEDGMEPVMLTQNPEVTQLLGARQFSVTEIARWFRLPPHFLGDLSRSTFSNIEAENLSFVVHSMLPWIVRWEKALHRQLLRPDEKDGLRFKFNVNGLLRGDTAARSQFYQAMFQLGAFSPNDIRESEDRNPIDGGDQYFVPGNNLIPLNKATELADAQIEQMNAKPAAPAPPQKPSESRNTVRRLMELRSLMESLIARQEEVERQAAGISNSTGVIASEVKAVAESVDKLGPLAESVPALAETVEGIPSKVSDVVAGGVQDLVKHSESQESRRVEMFTVKESEAAERQAETDVRIASVAEAIRVVTEQIGGVPDKVTESANVVVKMLVDHVENQEANRVAARAVSDAEMADRVEAIVGSAKIVVAEAASVTAEAIRSIPAAVADCLKPVTEQIQAIPAAVVESLPVVEQHPVVDTQQAEALAVRESQLAAKHVALTERLKVEREATYRAITLSLKRGVASLAVWEAKAITKAVEKPREWKEWRQKFYSRFRKQFEAEVGEFAADCEACGIALDLSAAAHDYARASIRDLETLDTFAADNYYDRVKEGAEFLLKTQWADRPALLAAEMVESGKQRFQAEEKANATPDD